MNTLNRQVIAPHRTTIACEGWPTEAAPRSGRAARRSVHHGGGGCPLRAAMVMVADGSREADETLERVLTCDPRLAVVRQADAGYPETIATAAHAHMDIPMGTPGGAAR